MHANLCHTFCGLDFGYDVTARTHGWCQWNYVRRKASDKLSWHEQVFRLILTKTTGSEIVRNYKYIQIWAIGSQVDLEKENHSKTALQCKWIYSIYVAVCAWFSNYISINPRTINRNDQADHHRIELVPVSKEEFPIRASSLFIDFVSTMATEIAPNSALAKLLSKQTNKFICWSGRNPNKFLDFEREQVCRCMYIPSRQRWLHFLCHAPDKHLQFKPKDNAD